MRCVGIDLILPPITDSENEPEFIINLETEYIDNEKLEKIRKLVDICKNTTQDVIELFKRYFGKRGIYECEEALIYWLLDNDLNGYHYRAWEDGVIKEEKIIKRDEAANNMYLYEIESFKNQMREIFLNAYKRELVEWRKQKTVKEALINVEEKLKELQRISNKLRENAGKRKEEILNEGKLFMGETQKLRKNVNSLRNKIENMFITLLNFTKKVHKEIKRKIIAKINEIKAKKKEILKREEENKKLIEKIVVLEEKRGMFSLMKEKVKKYISKAKKLIKRFSRGKGL